MAFNEDNNISSTQKTVFTVNTKDDNDAGRLTSILLGLPEIVGIEFDLAVVPHEIILYSDSVISVENIENIISSHGFEAIPEIILEPLHK